MQNIGSNDYLNPTHRYTQGRFRMATPFAPDSYTLYQRWLHPLPVMV
ncbi:hypothetical protein SAMN05444350_11189 [Bacteroides stercorirosoris]|uniref:Uncharacterized protein n=1 Tax=Bacteroides stercorirosoris TaxID=871324 RepID=A0A1M6F8Z7_9BACE|nr:hypothetical protein SAMN05444350_11189 [Bacteroides stercorirosoris]